jgi:hypothetical protein
MEKMDRPLHRVGPVHAEGILGRIGESLSSPPRKLIFGFETNGEIHDANVRHPLLKSIT